MPSRLDDQQEQASSPNEPHQARQIAESFGAVAGRYDRTRPRCPDALVEAVIAASPGREVLDVGCGTGIAARQFQAVGCRVLGVEPDEWMADWESAGRDFDAVIAGQAWHWVDPVAGAVKAAQVLRPGGRLAVFWNAFQPPPNLTEAFAAVYRRELPDLPFNPWARPALDRYLALGSKAAEGIGQAGAFGDPEQWRFDWDRPYTRDEWLEQVPTAGGHSQLPSAPAGRTDGGHRRRHRCSGEQVHGALHHRRGHGAANRRRLTRNRCAALKQGNTPGMP